jgi:electron-transferring-flavoprotein dehydrogenase
MLAAEHLAENDCATAGFDVRYRASAVARNRTVRNIKPGFKRGLWFAMANRRTRDRDRRSHALDAARASR